MDKFRYRILAGVIGSIDVVLLSIPILYVMGVTIRDGLDASSAVGSATPSQDVILGSLLLLAFIVIIFILPIVAAVKLIKATQLGVGVVLAAKRARFWRNFSILFAVLNSFGLSRPDNPILFVSCLLWTLFRVLGIYIVHQYILELDAAAASQTGILIVSVVVESSGPNEPAVSAKPQAQAAQGDLLPPAYDKVAMEQI